MESEKEGAPDRQRMSRETPDVTLDLLCVIFPFQI